MSCSLDQVGGQGMNMKDQHTLTSHERGILVVTCFGHFLSHFNMLAFPAVVLPLTERLALDMAEVIGISFWMYLLFGISALPWGMVADRWKGSSLMLLFFVGAGLSGLAAAWLVNSPAGLSVALAGLGVFSGIYHPTGLGMISKGIRRLALAMGYNGMFGNLGMTAAPLLTGVVNWLWGPREAFLFLGALNLAGAGLIIRLPLESLCVESESSTKGQDGLTGAFLILLVAMMLGGMAYRGATVIMPTYLELKSLGVLRIISGIGGVDFSGNLLATVSTSFVFLVGILGQYIGGHVADRFEPRHSYLVFHAACIPAAFLMAIATDFPLLALALIYFFFLLGMQPVENTLVARLTPVRVHHSAYGIKFVLTFGMGALAVKMVGWIEQIWEIDAVFPALGLISLTLVGAVVLLIRKSNSLGHS